MFTLITTLLTTIHIHYFTLARFTTHLVHEIRQNQDKLMQLPN